uniref:Uncharacterized protein n=1 Tax=Arundo donax TaxID=35708 RepID=A0A0A8Y5H2_ARUDO
MQYHSLLMQYEQCNTIPYLYFHIVCCEDNQTSCLVWIFEYLVFMIAFIYN